MFDFIGKKFNDIFAQLRLRGAINEADIDRSLRDIRIALLEADVALSVVKEMISLIKEKSIGREIIKSFSPDQMMTKIVHETLIDILGKPPLEKNLGQRIMLVGLQGSGKTTMSAKIAYLFNKQKKKCLLVSLDIYRPAAQEQLEILSKQINIESLPIEKNQNVLEIAHRSLSFASSYDCLIFDTAGRLHIDTSMMDELESLKGLIRPKEILWVGDALLGQDVMQTGKAFHDRINLTGIALSRLDADGRAGVALSIRKMLGVPIVFMGTGEKPADIEWFDPVRIADRILDRGDVLALIEKAQDSLTEAEQTQSMNRIKKGVFTLDDLGKHLDQIEKIGGVKGIFQFLPGMRSLKESLGNQIDKASFKKQKAILSSMTIQERRTPDILNASRKNRIAKGSGTQVCEINRLLKQFTQMQKMIKHFRHAKNPFLK